MPLSPPVERTRLHNRTYDFQGYQRADGLWDIEGRIVDTKTYPFANQDRGDIAPGEALHDMSIRLTIDEDFKVHDIEAATDFSPFTVCPEVTPNFKRMIGAEVRTGWRQQVRRELGGVEGCTHLVDLLIAMATVAFQTLYPVRAAKAAKRQPGERPGLLETCHAFATDSPIVRRSWPEFYTGPQAEREAEGGARRRGGGK